MQQAELGFVLAPCLVHPRIPGNTLGNVKKNKIKLALNCFGGLFED